MHINERRDRWLAAVAACQDPTALAELDSRLFGQKGEVLELVRSVTGLP